MIEWMFSRMHIVIIHLYIYIWSYIYSEREHQRQRNVIIYKYKWLYRVNKFTSQNYGVNSVCLRGWGCQKNFSFNRIFLLLRYPSRCRHHQHNQYLHIEHSYTNTIHNLYLISQTTSQIVQRRKVSVIVSKSGEYQKIIKNKMKS